MGTSTAQSSGVGILLVDDQEVIRVGLKLLLESLGFRVTGECGLASECLKMVTEAEFELVIVELGLPDMDGLTLIRRLQRARAELPVLVLSGQQAVASVVAAIQAGASGYAVKAAAAEELRFAVQTVADGGCYLHPRVAAPALAELRNGGRGWYGLAAREAVVVGYVLEGLSNAEIAGRLHVSVGTVKRDLGELYRKLEVSDRGRLAAEASRRGWRTS